MGFLRVNYDNDEMLSQLECHDEWRVEPGGWHYQGRLNDRPIQ